MKSPSRFVVELLRAANDPTRGDVFHVPSMLLESVEMINKLRRDLGVPVESPVGDVNADLRAVANSCEPFASAELTAALREAANAIRSLQILVDGGFSITPVRRHRYEGEQ